MQFYALLTALTLAIGGLSYLSWRQTKSVAILMGIAFLYYWSLFGSWALVYDLRGGDSGMHYQYLFDKMFAVDLDDDYFRALVYLGLFVISVQLTLLWYLVGPVLPKPLSAEKLICISHSKVLTFCALAGLLSWALMRDSLAYAVSNNIPIYLVTRGETDYDVIPLFTLHATLNRLALFPGIIGFVALISGRNVRMVVGRGGSSAVLGYVVLLSAMFAFCFVLGNKNELFAGLVTGVLFYLANDLRPRRFLLLGLGSLALAGVALIDFVRGTSLGDLRELLREESLFDAVTNIASSNEAFAGHMSMYGCMHYDVPLTYGSSIVSLLASVVPRNIWPDRPPDIYVHYVTSVQAAAGQGYSIHHAAGWYLNFGLLGVLLGGVLLGWVWSRLFLAARRIEQYRSPAVRLFVSFAALSFSAYLPTLIRSGPEVYKGAIIDAFLVPFIVLWMSHDDHRKKALAVNRQPQSLRNGGPISCTS